MTVLAEATIDQAYKFAEVWAPVGSDLETLHEYRDCEGKLLYWRARARNQETGEKWIRPLRLVGGGFALEAPKFPSGNPLYRLPALCSEPDGHVMLVVGERCADRLNEIGVLATTSGSAQSAGHADWSPLAGRSVCIWPDNDPAGYKYAEEAAERLLRIGCQVQVLDPKALGLGNKQDVVDWLENHPNATDSDIQELVDSAEERSGQSALTKLYENGFAKAETQDNDSQIDLLMTPGLVAIEISSPQGAAELLAAHEGFSLEGTWKITSGSSKYVFFRWVEIDPLHAPCEFSAGLVLIPSGGRISLPANGLWNTNAGECEVAFFPDWALKKWPVILQAQLSTASTEGSSLAALSRTAFAKDWPAPISGVAFIGLAGDYLKLVGPQTEADPSALLVSLLTGVGAMFENSVHAKVGATKHSTNLFSVIVGETAQARKGTAISEIVRFLGIIDPEFRKNILSGLSSGEGLIEAVRDPQEGMVPSNQKGKPAEWGIVDPGVADKRLLVRENEFAQVLQNMSRNGNTLSPILRQAWDCEQLRVMARSNKNRCMDPHIGLLASITNDELQQLLTSTDRSNGLANRILWTCARRVRVLPQGGDVDGLALEVLAKRLREVLQWALPGRFVKWGDAETEWAKLYYELSSAADQGMYGNITARAQPQVLRIALLYALLDQSVEIQIAHLNAAREVWRYCADSAQYIFGNFSRDKTEEVIFDAVQSRPDGINQTEINRLFKGHKTREQLQRALRSLQRQGLISSHQQDTDGRSALIWCAC
jgi:hypothetical protein